jgi:hypothetical protein
VGQAVKSFLSVLIAAVVLAAVILLVGLYRVS